MTVNEMVKRGEYTKGVLHQAMDMFLANKSYKEIYGIIEKVYIERKKTPQQAKHNTQAALWNAMKKLGIKKDDTTSIGYIKTEVK